MAEGLGKKKSDGNGLDNNADLILVLNSGSSSLKFGIYGRADNDADNDTVILNDGVHLGIAVASSRGLIVPVVRDAQLLTTEELCIQLAAAVEGFAENEDGAAVLDGLILEQIDGQGDSR